MTDARRYAVWPEPRSRSLKGSRPSVPHGTNFYFNTFCFLITSEVTCAFYLCNWRTYSLTLSLSTSSPAHRAHWFFFSEPMPEPLHLRLHFKCQRLSHKVVQLVAFRIMALCLCSMSCCSQPGVFHLTFHVGMWERLQGKAHICKKTPAIIMDFNDPGAV